MDVGMLRAPFISDLNSKNPKETRGGLLCAEVLILGLYPMGSDGVYTTRKPLNASKSKLLGRMYGPSPSNPRGRANRG